MNLNLNLFSLILLPLALYQLLTKRWRQKGSGWLHAIWLHKAGISKIQDYPIIFSLFF